MTNNEKTEAGVKAGVKVRTREKIIYKIIPVPYYYPVPANADWYDERSEKINNNDRSIVTSDKNFPTPPIFPYSFSKPPNLNDSYEMKKKTAPSPIAGKKRCKDAGKDAKDENTDSRFGMVDSTKDKKNEDGQVNRVDTETITIKTEDLDEAHHRTTVDNEVQNNPGKKLSDKAAADKMKQIKSAFSPPQNQQCAAFPYDNKTAKPINGQAEALKSSTVHPTRVQITHEDNTASQAEPSQATTEQPQHILVRNPALPSSGLSAIPGGNPHASRYAAVQSMQGVPMMISGGMPYVVVPMQPPQFHVQQAQVRPSNMEKMKPTPSSSPPPPPLRLPPPHLVIDTTKLASAELNSIKEDMRNWEMEVPKEREKYNHHHQGGGGRRSRTVFTRHQLITLNSIFKKQNFISGKRMRELSDELGLDRKTVKIWFQNKRQYLRKKASPQADVTFPNEEDYLVYRDISASEILHPPPTMTPTAGNPYNGAKDNLDITDTETGYMNESNDTEEISDKLENDVFDNNEIITVQMRHNVDDPDDDSPHKERGEILHREIIGVTMEDSVR